MHETDNVTDEMMEEYTIEDMNSEASVDVEATDGCTIPEYITMGCQGAN